MSKIRVDTMNLIIPFKGIKPANGKINLFNELFPSEKINPAVISDNKAAHIKMLINKKLLHADLLPSFYLYKITSSSEKFVGLITSMNIEAMHKKIFIHELTLRRKLSKLTQSLQKHKIQLNPALIIYPRSSIIEDIYSSIMLKKPDISFKETRKDTTHEIWSVNCIETINLLELNYRNIQEFYVADGHHRIAAAQDFSLNGKNKSNNYFLAILSAHDNIKIKSYNRLIRHKKISDENGFIKSVSTYYDLSLINAPKYSPLKGEFYLYCHKKWFCLKLKKNYRKTNNKNYIDAISINEFFFKKILGIKDQSLSRNIRFIPEQSDLPMITNNIDNNEFDAGIMIPRMQVYDFFDLVKNRIKLPPNSTWFEPKISDGIISLLYE